MGEALGGKDLPWSPHPDGASQEGSRSTCCTIMDTRNRLGLRRGVPLPLGLLT